MDQILLTRFTEGSTLEVLVPSEDNSLICKCTLICQLCKRTLFCLALSNASMYYIVSKDPKMTRVAVHYGTHEYPIAGGHCKEENSEILVVVKAQIAQISKAKPNTIEMVVSREVLPKELVDETHCHVVNQYSM